MDKKIKSQPADFTPEMGNFKNLSPFRYWCQKVLPAVYDDSLSYYELLCKVVDYLNKTMEDVSTLHGDITNLLKAYEELQNYVNNYFSSLDIQDEINNKLDKMVTDGTLENIINDKILNDVKGDIELIKSDITNLNDENNTLLNKINTLTKSTLYTQTKGEKAIFIGDSWTRGTGATSQDKRFSTVLSKMLGLTEINYGVSGIGFARQINGENMLALCRRVITEQKSVANDVKIIHLLGGLNDAYNRTSGSEVASSARNSLKELSSAFPNARIIFAPFNSALKMPYSSYIYYSILENCTFTSPIKISYCPNFPFVLCGNNSLYASDGNHPNDDGHRFLANYFASNILGNTYEQFYMPPSEYQFKKEAGVTLSISDITIHKINNFIVIPPFYITAPTNILNGGLQKIGTINPLYTPNVPIFKSFHRNHAELNKSIVGQIQINPDGAVYVRIFSGNNMTGAENLYVDTFVYLYTGGEYK